VLLEPKNARMKRALLTARNAASSDATVLLAGEVGTGKRTLARAIHFWGTRRSGPFAAVSCGSLGERVIEREIFGAVEEYACDVSKEMGGLLENAAGGTLLLDEIGALSWRLQTRLLQHLEDRPLRSPAKVRIIVSSSRDLEAETVVGSFRQDLYHRLNVVAIELPALRERLEDLPALAAQVLAAYSAWGSRPPLAIEPQAAAALAAYSWPGNVRQLIEVLEHAASRCSGDRIAAFDLPALVGSRASTAGHDDLSESTLNLESVQRRHIEKVLADCATFEEAAARLGIGSTTLWRKRKRYGL
jgi:NtrC-family two-component system response regulator AlgB